MGMERSPGISLLIVIVTLILGPGFHVYTIALAVVLLIVGTYALGKLAQYDPEFEAILIRYETYDRVYDAESPLENHVSLWASVRHLSVLAGKPLAGPLRPCVPTPRKI
jgi:type IV secretory pathway TrbD component